jgi:hypothetical protein
VQSTRLVNTDASVSPSVRSCAFLSSRSFRNYRPRTTHTGTLVPRLRHFLILYCKSVRGSLHRAGFGVCPLIQIKVASHVTTGCRLLAVCCAALVVVACSSSDPAPPPPAGFVPPRADGVTPSSAYFVCKNEVTERLKAPATAKWAPASSAFIKDRGEGRFTVTSHVDSQNVYGALLRSNFVCDLRYQGQGRWDFENVQIAER